jgi:hypothetical protein
MDQIWRRIESAHPESVGDSLEDLDFGQGAGFRLFCLVDPDGNILRIREPIDTDE